MTLKNSSIRFLYLIVIVFLFSMCSGCKSGYGSINYKNQVYKNGDAIEITGRILRVGNEPFTHLIIIDDSGERFSIAKELEESVLKTKSNYVKITGTLDLKKLVTADGKKTSLIREIIPDSIEAVK